MRSWCCRCDGLWGSVSVSRQCPRLRLRLSSERPVSAACNTWPTQPNVFAVSQRPTTPRRLVQHARGQTNMLGAALRSSGARAGRAAARQVRYKSENIVAAVQAEAEHAEKEASK